MDDSWFSDDQATFGDRLTAAREAAGLSGTELARRLGVNRRTVAAWEQDQAEPRANRMQMLAGLLNVSLRWLMSGEGPGVAPPVSDESGAPPPPAALEAIQAEMRALRGLLAQVEDRTRRLDRRIAEAMGQ